MNDIDWEKELRAWQDKGVVLSEEQRLTLQRLEDGIDRISEAVDRLNGLGMTVGMPFVTLRCWHDKGWHDEHYFIGLICDKKTEDGLAQIAAIELAKENGTFKVKA